MTNNCSILTMRRGPRGATVLCALLGAALGGWALPARADLSILITKGVTDPIPIAIVPFARGAGGGDADLASVVQHDLDGSGRFHSMARADMPATPTTADAVHVADWHNAGNDYVLVGRQSEGAGSTLAVDCDLVNARSGEHVASQHFLAGAGGARGLAHQVSDFVYEKILGVPGAFATRIAYVAVHGQGAARHFQLVVADADGEAPHVMMESSQPIMSPAWSPDQQWLAYVSFENRVAAVFVQRVRTGERHMVSARAGVNGAPAFSPDGTRLALTLSGRSGNLDIWLLNLGTQQLTRLTDDPAVDTEPAWAADGHTLYFTSDRAGGPQIYKLDVNQPAHVERVTFGSPYNARPRLSPDGHKLAFVTRDGRNYRIAVQDLASGTVTVLSHGSLDESPSFAPNGASIIFASREGEVGALQTVSVDGQVTQRLRSDQGEVREPVWGGAEH